MLGGAKPLISGQGRGLKGREGWGSWGGGNQPLPTSLGVWGSDELPQRDLGRSPADKRFASVLEAPEGLSWNLLGAKFEGGMAPLNPPTVRNSSVE